MSSGYDILDDFFAEGVIKDWPQYPNSSDTKPADTSTTIDRKPDVNSEQIEKLKRDNLKLRSRVKLYNKALEEQKARLTQLLTEKLALREEQRKYVDYGKKLEEANLCVQATAQLNKQLQELSNSHEKEKDEWLVKKTELLEQIKDLKKSLGETKKKEDVAKRRKKKYLKTLLELSDELIQLESLPKKYKRFYISWKKQLEEEGDDDCSFDLDDTSGSPEYSRVPIGSLSSKLNPPKKISHDVGVTDTLAVMNDSEISDNEDSTTPVKTKSVTHSEKTLLNKSEAYTSPSRKVIPQDGFVEKRKNEKNNRIDSNPILKGHDQSDAKCAEDIRNTNCSGNTRERVGFQHPKSKTPKNLTQDAGIADTVAVMSESDSSEDEASKSPVKAKFIVQSEKTHSKKSEVLFSSSVSEKVAPQDDCFEKKTDGKNNRNGTDTILKGNGSCVKVRNQPVRNGIKNSNPSPCLPKDVGKGMHVGDHNHTVKNDERNLAKDRSRNNNKLEEAALEVERNILALDESQDKGTVDEQSSLETSSIQSIMDEMILSLNILQPLNDQKTSDKKPEEERESCGMVCSSPVKLSDIITADGPTEDIGNLSEDDDASGMDDWGILPAVEEEEIVKDRRGRKQVILENTSVNPKLGNTDRSAVKNISFEGNCEKAISKKSVKKSKKCSDKSENIQLMDSQKMSGEDEKLVKVGVGTSNMVSKPHTLCSNGQAKENIIVNPPLSDLDSIPDSGFNSPEFPIAEIGDSNGPSQKDHCSNSSVAETFRDLVTVRNSVISLKDKVDPNSTKVVNTANKVPKIIVETSDKTTLEVFESCTEKIKTPCSQTANNSLEKGKSPPKSQVNVVNMNEKSESKVSGSSRCRKENEDKMESSGSRIRTRSQSQTRDDSVSPKVRRTEELKPPKSRSEKNNDIDQRRKIKKGGKTDEMDLLDTLLHNKEDENEVRIPNCGVKHFERCLKENEESILTKKGNVSVSGSNKEKVSSVISTLEKDVFEASTLLEPTIEKPSERKKSLFSPSKNNKLSVTKITDNDDKMSGFVENMSCISDEMSFLSDVETNDVSLENSFGENDSISNDGLEYRGSNTKEHPDSTDNEKIDLNPNLKELDSRQILGSMDKDFTSSVVPEMLPKSNNLRKSDLSGNTETEGVKTSAFASTSFASFNEKDVECSTPIPRISGLPKDVNQAFKLFLATMNPQISSETLTKNRASFDASEMNPCNDARKKNLGSTMKTSNSDKEITTNLGIFERAEGYLDSSIHYPLSAEHLSCLKKPFSSQLDSSDEEKSKTSILVRCSYKNSSKDANSSKSDTSSATLEKETTIRKSTNVSNDSLPCQFTIQKYQPNDQVKIVNRTPKIRVKPKLNFSAIRTPTVPFIFGSYKFKAVFKVKFWIGGHFSAESFMDAYSSPKVSIVCLGNGDLKGITRKYMDSPYKYAGVKFSKKGTLSFHCVDQYLIPAKPLINLFSKKPKFSAFIAADDPNQTDAIGNKEVEKIVGKSEKENANHSGESTLAGIEPVSAVSELLNNTGSSGNNEANFTMENIVSCTAVNEDESMEGIENNCSMISVTTGTKEDENCEKSCRKNSFGEIKGTEEFLPSPVSEKATSAGDLSHIENAIFAAIEAEYSELLNESENYESDSSDIPVEEPPSPSPAENAISAAIKAKNTELLNESENYESDASDIPVEEPPSPSPAENAISAAIKAKNTELLNESENYESDASDIPVEEPPSPNPAENAISATIKAKNTELLNESENYESDASDIPVEEPPSPSPAENAISAAIKAQNTELLNESENCESDSSDIPTDKLQSPSSGDKLISTAIESQNTELLNESENYESDTSDIPVDEPPSPISAENAISAAIESRNSELFKESENNENGIAEIPIDSNINLVANECKNLEISPVQPTSPEDDTSTKLVSSEKKSNGSDMGDNVANTVLSDGAHDTNNVADSVSLTQEKGKELPFVEEEYNLFKLQSDENEIAKNEKEPSVMSSTTIRGATSSVPSSTLVSDVVTESNEISGMEIHSSDDVPPEASSPKRFVMNEHQCSKVNSSPSTAEVVLSKESKGISKAVECSRSPYRRSFLPSIIQRSRSARIMAKSSVKNTIKEVEKSEAFRSSSKLTSVDSSAIPTNDKGSSNVVVSDRGKSIPEGKLEENMESNGEQLEKIIDGKGLETFALTGNESIDIFQSIDAHPIQISQLIEDSSKNVDGYKYVELVTSTTDTVILPENDGDELMIVLDPGDDNFVPEMYPQEVNEIESSALADTLLCGPFTLHVDAQQSGNEVFSLVRENGNVPDNSKVESSTPESKAETEVENYMIPPKKRRIAHSSKDSAVCKSEAKVNRQKSLVGQPCGEDSDSVNPDEISASDHLDNSEMSNRKEETLLKSTFGSPEVHSLTKVKKKSRKQVFDKVRDGANLQYSPPPHEVYKMLFGDIEDVVEKEPIVDDDPTAFKDPDNLCGDFNESLDKLYEKTKKIRIAHSPKIRTECTSKVNSSPVDSINSNSSKILRQRVSKSAVSSSNVNQKPKVRQSKLSKLRTQIAKVRGLFNRPVANPNLPTTSVAKADQHLEKNVISNEKGDADKCMKSAGKDKMKSRETTSSCVEVQLGKEMKENIDSSNLNELGNTVESSSLEVTETSDNEKSEIGKEIKSSKSIKKGKGKKVISKKYIEDVTSEEEDSSTMKSPITRSRSSIKKLKIDRQKICVKKSSVVSSSLEQESSSESDSASSKKEHNRFPRRSLRSKVNLKEGENLNESSVSERSVVSPKKALAKNINRENKGEKPITASDSESPDELYLDLVRGAHEDTERSNKDLSSDLGTSSGKFVTKVNDRGKKRKASMEVLNGESIKFEKSNMDAVKSNKKKYKSTLSKDSPNADNSFTTKSIDTGESSSIDKSSLGKEVKEANGGEESEANSVVGGNGKESVENSTDTESLGNMEVPPLSPLSSDELVDSFILCCDSDNGNWSPMKPPNKISEKSDVFKVSGSIPSPQNISLTSAPDESKAALGDPIIEGEETHPKEKIKDLFFNIAKENKSNYYLHNIKSESNSENKKILKTLLGRLHTPKYTTKSMDDLIEGLNDESKNFGSKAVAKYLVRQLSKEDEDDVQHPIFRGVPRLSELQFRTLALILALERRCPRFRDLIDTILKGITYLLFRLGHAPEVTVVMSLARMFTVICKIRKDLQTARTFCYDALFCLGLKAYAVIFIVLSVWPEVFRKLNKDREADAIESSIFISLMELKVSKKKGEIKVVPVQNILRNTYFFDESLKSDHLIKKLMLEMKEGKFVSGAEAATILLCKKKGWNWTHGNLLCHNLVSILEDYEQGKISVNAAAAAVKLMGYVSRSCSNETAGPVKCIVDYLYEAMENQDKYPMLIQEAIAQSLICLSRFYIHRVTNALDIWTPTTMPSERLIKRMVNLVRNTPKKFWVRHFGQWRSKVRKPKDAIVPMDPGVYTAEVDVSPILENLGEENMEWEYINEAGEIVVGDNERNKSDVKEASGLRVRGGRHGSGPPRGVRCRGGWAGSQAKPFPPNARWVKMLKNESRWIEAENSKWNEIAWVKNFNPPRTMRREAQVSYQEDVFN